MAFEALKERQSAAWGSAPYENVSRQHLHVVEELLDWLDPRPGERLLDVATGTGELARPAARRGVEVTASDFAAGLLDTARRRAEDEGAPIAFVAGDAERLPFADASFDLVASTFGAMFAPDHRAVAGELARVVRADGRLGLAAWEPGGGAARMFTVMRPYMPPPPDGAGNPFDWGRPEHVEALLGDAFALEFRRGVAPQVGASGKEMWELMSGSYGPTRVLAEGLEEARRDDLRRDFSALYEEHRHGDVVSLPREYLLVLGRRRSS
jgi:ubiquinone/menaquinone biosynthesis C-methylase UbiE